MSHSRSHARSRGRVDRNLLFRRGFAGGWAWITLAVGGSLTALAQPGGSEAVLVEVATVVQKDVSEGQAYVGSVMPARRTTVGSAVAGRVETLFVDEGDAVGMMDNDDREVSGQELVQLRTSTIDLEIAAATAEARLREKEWEELKNGSRPEEIAQATARWESAAALATYAEARFNRIGELYRKNTSATQEQFDEARSAKIAADKVLEGARAELDLVTQGPRGEKIEQAKARWDMAEAEVQRLQDMRAKYTLRAPYPGYVVSMLTEKGAWIQQGDPVAEIVELDPVEIVVSVPEAYITALREGMQIRAEVDALPDQLFEGTVYRIVPQADLRSRTFPVKVRLSNPAPGGDPLLKAGMLARVMLAVGEPRPALMVPKDALVLDVRATQIVVVDQKLQIRLIPVQLGVAQEGLIQVMDSTGSLREGDQVVIRGNERLRPGQTVEIQTNKR